MGNSRVDSVKKNMFWGMMMNIVSAVFPFVIRKMITSYIGVTYLGLSNICTSILDVLNITNLGIDAALMYHLYKPIAQEDYPRLNQLLHFYKTLYMIIAGIVFLAGIIILPFFKKLITEEIPSNTNIYVVFLLYLLGNVCSYLTVQCRLMILQAFQKIHIVYKIMIAHYIFLYGLQMVFIVERKYYMYVAVQVIAILLIAVFMELYLRKRHPEITFRSDAKIETSFIKTTFKESLSVAIYRIRNTFRTSADTIVISAILGLEAVAYYQNYIVVMTAALLVTNLLCNSLTASIGDLNAHGDVEGVRNVYRISLTLQLFISGICAIGYFFLIQDFINFWMGKKAVLTEMTAGLMAVYLYVQGIGSMMSMIRNISGCWEKGRVIAFIETAVNVGLNIFFATRLGITGIVLATVLSMCVIYIPAEVYYLSMSTAYIRKADTIQIIGRNVSWMIISAVSVYWLYGVIGGKDAADFIIKAVLCVLVPIIIYGILYWRTAEVQSMVHILFKNGAN